jgi:hypothetical protein
MSSTRCLRAPIRTSSSRLERMMALTRSGRSEMPSSVSCAQGLVVDVLVEGFELVSENQIVRYLRT